jgi:hypothetical protein
MSKVVIQGNASGTGDFTIAAPNSNTNRTLTLPDEAGTVLTTAGVPSSALPAGSVLQVVTSSSNTTQSGTGLVGILTASITPISASSKIFALGNLAVGLTASSNAYGTGFIFRGTTSGTQIAYVYSGVQSAIFAAMNLSVFGIDSPNTTSAQIYTLAVNKGSGGTTSWSTDGTFYSLTLMEIAV